MGSSYFLFVGLLILGPIISISSSNWMICWGGIELSFLGLIPLLFVKNKYISLSKESAMKYFCVQALGSALMFLGGLVAFSSSITFFSMSVFITGIFIKLGVFPFHFWVPSVVSGVDWMPMYFLLTIQKIGPLAFLNLSHSFFDETFGFCVLLLAGLTSVAGAFVGNNQSDVRPMLGASSIVHSGWLLLAFLSGNLWVYFAVYCVSLALAFYFLSGTTVAFDSGLGLLSLSGLPPFLLFIGKWGVIKAFLETDLAIWPLGFFLLGALLSLFFYLKFSYSMFMNAFSSPYFSPSMLSCLPFISLNCIIFMFFLIM